ncbi:MAG: xanthine dehydrogenase family protein molybdopterin-binding subunit [Hyphomicrobiaceae bacterium]
MTSIGRSIKRFEDERLLRGEGRFVESLIPGGALEAMFLRSPFAHARIARIDCTAARAMPGVVGVLTGRDLVDAGAGPLKCRRTIPSIDGTPFHEPVRHALALETVRFVGEAVALVIAESRAAALDALDMIEVDYDPLPLVVDPLKSTEIAFTWAQGDRDATDAVFRTAPLVTSFSGTSSRMAAVPIEPRSAIAEYDPVAARYRLVTQSQGVHLLRAAYASSLGIAPEALHLQTFDVGGSFGMKLIPHPEPIALLTAARLVGRTLAWVSTRSEAFLSDNYARDQTATAELAMDRDGTFLALRISSTGNMGAYASSSAPGVMAIHFARTVGHVYRIPVHHVHVTSVYTNMTPTDVFRGAGKPESTVLVERLIDRAACRHGFDRLDLRRRNLVTPADMPRRTLSGHMIDGGDFPRTLDHALVRADWRGFEARRAETLSRGRLRGIGVGLYMHVTSHPVVEECRVRLLGDGTFEATMGAQGIGQGHETTFSQLLGDTLKVEPDAIRIVQGDSAVLPPVGAATGGSGSIQVTGLTLLKAARLLIDRLRPEAAEMLEASPADLEHATGGFRIKGTDRAVGFAAIAGRMDDDAREDCAGDAHFEGDAATCPNGAYIAEVEVDPATGEVEILRFSGADDVGRRLNPMIVDGQLHGGIAQGIGQAMLERVVYDEESGQLLSGSLMDYALPLASDLPSFELVAADCPSSQNELGMKGAGECGTIGAPGALLNAIADAIGTDEFDMPATTERVWRAIRLKRGD